MNKFTRLIILIFILTFTCLGGIARSQDNPAIDDFSVLMEKLISRLTTIEAAYSPSLTVNIARTRRIEIWNECLDEITLLLESATTFNDSNTEKLIELLEESRWFDPTNIDFLPVLDEICVRAIILECRLNGIGPDIVAEYIERSSTGYVADHGNFSHPEYDTSSLSANDYMRIYYCGFGLIVLFNMDGGLEYAPGIYLGSTELKKFWGSQLIYKAVTHDVEGLGVIESVLSDPALGILERDYYFSVIADRIYGPPVQFSDSQELSTDWKEAIAQWTYDHITSTERTDAMWSLSLYGIDPEATTLTPEALLGLLGPEGQEKIVDLLNSDNLMENVSGLKALMWFDVDTYPDLADPLFESAGTFLASSDFTVAMLAYEVYTADARYFGEPYDSARRDRLRRHIPFICELIDRILEFTGVENLDRTAVLDIFAEGTLADNLADCVPMVIEIVLAEWERKQSGEIADLPEGEIDILIYFMVRDQTCFYLTTDAVRGFLVEELNSGTVNPFGVWTYANFVMAARISGIDPGDEWRSVLARLNDWVDNQTALVRGDDLKAVLDDLLNSQEN